MEYHNWHTLVVKKEEDKTFKKFITDLMILYLFQIKKFHLLLNKKIKKEVDIFG